MWLACYADGLVSCPRRPLGQGGRQPWHLPGSGTFVARPLRQGQPSALVVAPIPWAGRRWALAPQAFLATGVETTLAGILGCFVSRTFREVRAHLGVETQRQWSQSGDRAHHAGAARAVLPGDDLDARID